MEATSAAFGPKAPGPHSAHALPPQSGRLSGGAGGKGVPANFAGLGVFALRSRRKNPVGRTRGGEDLVGELWRFYAGRSVAGAQVAAHRLRSDAFERQMTVRRGAFGMAVGVI